nr:aminodeoxychorismate/anthranilate synthase component II [uncultured Flavobacterium sp.]
MNKILLIDNFDSFTHNIKHLIIKLGFEVETIRNNEFSIDYIENYEKIIISPGPGLPDEANLIIDIIQKYHKNKSILGICLGHQAIAMAFNGRLKNLSKVYHGVSSEITILDNDEILFKNLPKKFDVARYHSWAIDENNLSEDLKITAISNDGTIMAVKHKTFDVRGIQFHPESILTPFGEEIMKNWLDN